MFRRQVRPYFRPNLLLGRCQAIRQRLQQTAGLCHIDHRILVLHDLVILPHPTQHQDKKQKFIENQPLSGLHQQFFAVRKMHLPYGIL